LGMTRREIRRKFDDIVNFAEIERFLDTPVKRYSNGMYIRLAVAVAAHLEPDILVVDEVLAVGDATFQKKCMGEMSEVAHAGRTVLFVSHNMAAVASLCTRALLLEEGRVIADTSVSAALRQYGENYNTLVSQAKPRSDTPSVCRVELDPQALQDGHLSLAIHFESPFPIDPVVGVVVSSHQGTPLFGSNPLVHGEGYQSARVRQGVATLRIPDLPLHSGSYRLSVWLSDGHHTIYDKKADVLVFEFVSPYVLPGGLSTDTIGPYRTRGQWTLAP